MPWDAPHLAALRDRLIAELPRPRVGIGATDAHDLLHQFSEWRDYARDGITSDMTHDDIVRTFLAQRGANARPEIRTPPSAHVVDTNEDGTPA